ncbi:RNase A-like domain-containing protein [Bradyrhizobium sp.]|jgi:hypothetical protein|uniref:RNase A-like domain-containing protein n=1 Tax=Bradyrhizobium sp. TaxID=376 RepID=UPI002DF9C9D9|nr:RNase A-like domain-containing protein [Bradyrhizobium sp.]
MTRKPQSQSGPTTHVPIRRLLTLARKPDAAQAAFEAEVEAAYQRHAVLREQVAELRAELKRRRLEEVKYSPSQPRVPSGNPRGGQWTDRGGGQGTVAGPSQDTGQGTGTSLAQPMGNVDIGDVSRSSELGDLFRIKPDGARTDAGNRSDSIVKIAADDSGRRYHPDLVQEEARGGHTFREHTDKTGEELMEGTTLVRGRAGIYRYARKRWGSFEPREAATDLVHRTLEQNRDQVDAVATGQLKDAFVTARFNYKTGREAFRSNVDAKPYLRDTYGVGVLIEHDRRAERGYSVITAYPRNDD